MSTAHVTYTGGWVMLPVRTSYDRELLVDHVVQRVGRTGVTRVELDGRVWSVRQVAADLTAPCVCCGRPLGANCCVTTLSEAPQCTRCAFVGPPRSSTLITEEAAANGAVNARARASRSAIAAVLQWTGIRLPGRAA